MEWRPVPEAPGYEANALGQIRSPRGNILSDKAKRRYPAVNIMGKTRLVHVIIAELFVPNPDNKPEVNHEDGNKRNSKADNLSWMTRPENIQHGYDTGLFPRIVGEAHAGAKLTEEDVRDIRKMNIRDGVSQHELGRMYEVSVTTIRYIIIGKTWSHVEDD